MASLSKKIDFKEIEQCIEHYQEQYIAINYWMKRYHPDTVGEERDKLERKYIKSLTKIGTSLQNSLQQQGITLDINQVSTLLLTPAMEEVSPDDLQSYAQELQDIENEIKRQLETKPQYDTIKFKDSLQQTRSDDVVAEIAPKTP